MSGQTTSNQRPMTTMHLSRRSFLAMLGAAPLALSGCAEAVSRGRVPIGIQLFSVRDEVQTDLMGTLTAIREMGYECVEFWAPYFEWTNDYASEVKQHIDGLGLACYSTHTAAQHFAAENLPRAIELNQILGSRYVIMAHAGRQPDLDGWRRTADVLAAASETLQPLGMSAGYHNYDIDFRPVDGIRPIDILTSNTPAEVFFQFDVATGLAARIDPLEYIRANPGRIKSYHVKDWSPDTELGYRVLLGEGIGPWQELFEVAETVGGVEYYLIEQEGSRFSSMETAKRCLENYHQLRST